MTRRRTRPAPRPAVRLAARTRPRIRSRAATAVALVLAAVAATGTAHAAGPRLVMLPGATMPLGLPGFGGIVADDAVRSVFVSSGPTGHSVAEIGYTGTVTATLEHENGASGMVLSPDGQTLYVALANADAVVAIDTAAFTEKARYPLPAHSCPTTLARTGPDVWIGYGCAGAAAAGAGGTSGVGAGVAVLATDAASPTVVLGKQDSKTPVRYAAAPILAAADSPATPTAATSPADTPDPTVATAQGSTATALHPAATTTTATTATTPTPDRLVVGEPGQSANDLATYTTTAGPDPSLTLVSSAPRSGGGELTDLAVSPDAGTAFAASGSQATVDAFTTSGLADAGQYQTGLGPDALALSPDGTELAATTSIPESNVYVWRIGAPAAPIGDYSLPLAGAPAPRGLAFSGDGSMLFLVTDPASGSGGPTLEVLRLQ
ncbi:hypothetical protein KDL01_16075 [Actinospica durhamensis]|uniref:Uncharacterized protein n=1 Tax=Actinospica durhamensis TaxID=1508375 RepID=A0A941IP76_9ACTN|nr:hypothetical protein [Actinospica durhamensis]MBR7834794.1 hypothetical protein [Actinospica durhamensis]